MIHSTQVRQISLGTASGLADSFDGPSVPADGLSLGCDQRHHSSALLCSQNTSPEAAAVLICSSWQRAASTKDTACAADDVSCAGWTIVPCRIAVMSASQPTVPDYHCSRATQQHLF